MADIQIYQSILTESQTKLQDTQKKVEDLCRLIASDPTKLAENHESLQQLLKSREDIATLLGSRLAEWIALGGTITLSALQAPPKPISDPPPPTAPTPEVQPPPPQPISLAPVSSIQSFVEQFSRSKTAVSERIPTKSLQAFYEYMGPPVDVTDMSAAVEETDKLLAAVQMDWLEKTLGQCAPSDQRIALGYLIARVRNLRENQTVRAADLARKFTGVLNNIPSFSATHRPGYVNGLTLSHTPASGVSWYRDAVNFWAEIEPRFKKEEPPSLPPKKISQPPVTETEEESDPKIPDTWKGFDYTTGRRALLIGGTPRELNRQRLEETFRFSDLVWVGADSMTKIASANGQIKKHKYDHVFVIVTMVSHKVSESVRDTAQSSKVPFSFINGYGVTAMKLAVEDEMITDLLDKLLVNPGEVRWAQRKKRRSTRPGTSIRSNARKIKRPSKTESLKTAGQNAKSVS